MTLRVAVALIALIILPAQSNAQGPRISVTPGVRIGSEDGEHDAFGAVTAVTMKFGNIYVADRLSSSITVFNSAGQFVRTLGRKGSGPGEFRSLYSIGWIADTLYAVDMQAASISLFPKGVSHFSTFALPDRRAVPNSIITLPLAVLPLRNTISQIMPIDAGPVAIFARIDAKGNVADTLSRMNHRNAELRAKWATGSMALEQPFGDFDLAAAGGGYSYRIERPAASATIGRIRVTQFDQRKALWSRSYTVPANKLSADSGAIWTSKIIKDNPSISNPEIRAGIAAGLYNPAFAPVVVKGVAGDDGRLWVRLGGSQHSLTTWLVIHRDGTLAGHVVLPFPEDIAFATTDQFWTRWIDGEGVWRLQQYRLK